MTKFWQVARWVVMAVCLLALVLVFVRGPEDTWIRDSQGNWVAHGHPAGPPPPAGYRAPAMERYGPLAALVVMVAALFATLFLTGRSPSGADALSSNIRYLGAVSIFGTAVTLLLVFVLVLGMATELGAAFRDPGLVVLTLLAVALTAKLVSWQAYTTKKVVEAHYDLKRAVALLQDTVERWRDAAGDKGAGSGPL
jgi:hypothetical protein